MTDQDIAAAVAQAERYIASYSPGHVYLAENVLALAKECKRLKEWQVPIIMERDQAVQTLQQVEAECARQTEEARWRKAAMDANGNTVTDVGRQLSSARAEVEALRKQVAELTSERNQALADFDAACRDLDGRNMASLARGEGDIE